MPSEVCVVNGPKKMCCLSSPPCGRDTWLSLSRGDTGRKKEEVSEQVRLPEGPREGPDSDPAVTEESGCSGKPLGRIANQPNHGSDLYRGILQQSLISLLVAPSQPKWSIAKSVLHSNSLSAQRKLSGITRSIRCLRHITESYNLCSSASPLVPQLCSFVRRPGSCPAQLGPCVPAGPWTAAEGHGSLSGQRRTEEATEPSLPPPFAWVLSSPLRKGTQEEK